MLCTMGEFLAWLFDANTPLSNLLAIVFVIGAIIYAVFATMVYYEVLRGEKHFDPLERPRYIGQLLAYIAFAPQVVLELAFRLLVISFFRLIQRVCSTRIEAVVRTPLPERVCPHCGERCWAVKKGSQVPIWRWGRKCAGDIVTQRAHGRVIQ
jgi:hypothetical protein